MKGIIRALKRATTKGNPVLPVLMEMEREQAPIRVEIENSLIRFNSTLAIRSDRVVIAKPLGLNKHISRTTALRLRMPNGKDEVRLEVGTPHFNLTNGNAAMLCSIPKEYCASSNRTEYRYNTRRFNNLILQVKDVSGAFRIIDISNSGCRIYARSVQDIPFNMGERVENAEIRLGNKITVQLDHFTLRSRQRLSVGMEFHVSDDGRNKTYLRHLIESLDRAERDQNRAMGL